MNNEIFGVNISNLPDRFVEIPSGCEPKVKCKNKFIQRILIKIFGLKPVYKTIQAKVITTRAEDCPKNWDGTLNITLEKIDANYIHLSKTNKGE